MSDESKYDLPVHLKINIPMIRRLMPSLVTSEIVGVQPMTTSFRTTMPLQGDKFKSDWFVRLDRVVDNFYILEPPGNERCSPLISAETEWLTDNGILEGEYFIEYSYSPFSSRIEFTFGFLSGETASEFKLRFG